MNLLTPDRPGSNKSREDLGHIRFVSDFSSEARTRSGSNWLVLVAIALAFGGGFGLSSYWRPVSHRG
jgi:hypothetical protein